MVMIAEVYDYVIGGDPDRDTIDLAVLDTATGRVRAHMSDQADGPDYRRLLAWALETGVEVAEVRPGARSTHAHAGKSDLLDAEAAARAVLGREYCALARPRHSGDRTALRVLLASRSLIDQQCTANRNALTALLRSIDLGVDARKPLSNAQIKMIAAWRTVQDRAAIQIARAEAKRPASSVVDQTRQLTANLNLLRTHAEQLAPGLQNTVGIGPMTASAIVCAYSHRGRVRSEAAFAALAGVAPTFASSGNTTRHRLSRSGDRQLNRAFDTIVRTRMSSDPGTRDYLQRRTAEGKTRREARRTLKQYVYRSVFRQLQTCMA